MCFEANNGLRGMTWQHFECLRRAWTLKARFLELRGVKNTGLSWTPLYLQMEISMTGTAQSEFVIIGTLRDNDLHHCL